MRRWWILGLAFGSGCVSRLLGDDPQADGGLESSTAVSISGGDSSPQDDGGVDDGNPDDGDPDDGNPDDDGTLPPDLPSVGCGEGELCLQESSRTKVGGVPDDIAVADLDEDGLLDLAVANSASDDVSLLHGFGDGTFTDIALVPICAGPRSVAAADFDADGHADLAFACAVDSIVFVMLGDGTGSFPVTIEYESPYAPLRVYAAQVDGDGRTDLLLVNYYGAVPQDAASYSVWTQPTAMVFAESANITDELYSEPGIPGFGDVDLDGDLDLVAAGRVAFGDGSGAFPDGTVIDMNTGGTYALRDIDGDGPPDLVEAGGYPHATVLRAGTGAGDFLDAGSLDHTFSPTLLEFGDLDGDGGRDLVTIDSGGLTAWRWESGFAFAGPWTFDPANDLRGLVVVDLNADGRDDVVVASASAQEVVALLSTP